MIALDLIVLTIVLTIKGLQGEIDKFEAAAGVLHSSVDALVHGQEISLFLEAQQNSLLENYHKKILITKLEKFRSDTVDYQEGQVYAL